MCWCWVVYVVDLFVVVYVFDLVDVVIVEWDMFGVEDVVFGGLLDLMYCIGQ